MASLLEMRFDSEGEEDDTDYEESSASEQGTHSGSSSSSSDEEVGTQGQQQQRRSKGSDAYYRRRGTTRTEETSSAAAAIASAADVAAPVNVDTITAAPSLSNRYVTIMNNAPEGVLRATAPSAKATAATAFLEETRTRTGNDISAQDRKTAADAASDKERVEDVTENGNNGEMQLHGRSHIFSRHSRNRREQKSGGQHKKRHAERLKAHEIFKEMQEAEEQALRSYPSAVDPDDFLLQFQRRCPPEKSSYTRSWQHLRHHLSIAVSALRRPGSQVTASVALQQSQSPPTTRRLCQSGDVASVTSSTSPSALSVTSSAGASVTSAAVAVPSAAAAVTSATAVSVTSSAAPSSVCFAAAASVGEPFEAYATTGALSESGSPSVAVSGFPPQPQKKQHTEIVSSVHQERQQPPTASASLSVKQPIPKVALTATSLVPAVLQEPVLADDPFNTTSALTAICKGAEEVTTRLREKHEDENLSNSILPPAAPAGGAASSATGDALAGHALKGTPQQQHQQQTASCAQALSEDGGSPCASDAESTAGTARPPSANVSLPGEVLQSSPVAPSVSHFSIRECKERCRKKLSKATLTKMMQEAIHSMENAGEVSVKKVVRFAGETIEVEERMEAASARYQQILELRRRAPQHVGGRFAGLDGLVAALDDPSSINSVQKSQADWEMYKHEKGLAAELAKGHGFLQKQAFLAQAEWKQHERNVEARRKRQAEHRRAEQ